MHPSPANCRRRAAAAGSRGALAAAAAVILSFFVATAVHPTDHSVATTRVAAFVPSARRGVATAVHPTTDHSVATTGVAAFVPSARRGRSRIIAAYTSSDGGNDKSEEPSDDGSEDDDGLAWRLAKVRLEEANTRRFLKSQPLKMSYADSQQWIQRNWAPKSQEEFEDLVANGNLRTPYISKRPEEYYGRRGEWISWEHYLLGEEGCQGLNDTEAEWQ